MRLLSTLLASLFLSNLVIAQCDDFIVDLSFTNPLCPDYSDGSVTAVPSGGAEPYTILITNAGGELQNLDGGSETGFLLPEGCYYIEIEDAIGCTFTDSVLLVDPLEINVESYTLIDPTELGACDGSITLDEVTGDFDDVFVNWSPDPDGISGLGAFGFTEACAGVYEVTLLSELGCAISAEYEIGVGLSISDNAQVLFEIYTNQNGLNVYSKYKDQAGLTIYNASGKVLQTSSVYNGTTVLDLSTSGLVLYVINDSDNTILARGKLVLP